MGISGSALAIKRPGCAHRGGLRTTKRRHGRSPYRWFSLSMLWLIIVLTPSGSTQAAQVAHTGPQTAVDQRMDDALIASAAPHAGIGGSLSEHADVAFTQALPALASATSTLPSLSISDARIAEGNNGTSSVIFMLRLAPWSPKLVTVDYTTRDGSANAPHDYGAREGTVTFPRKTQVQTITVPIVGDSLIEDDEAFYVQLINPTNATIGRATAEVIISNDDQQPLPTATTTTAAGAEDTAVTIALNGVDAAYPLATLQVTITTLPSRGQLAQMDGTLIAEVGTRVTDSERRVRFLGGAHEHGTPYAMFGYTLTSSGSGLTSPPQIVSVSLAPAPDPPATVADYHVKTQEEVPVTFALPGSDPDGDALTAFVTAPPVSRGMLYQVLADGHTIGPAMAANMWVQVTNPDRLVHYVPPRDAHGLPLTLVNYYLQDSSGLVSAPGRELGGQVLFIDVTNVNDAPVARPLVHLSHYAVSVLGVSLSYSDRDQEPLTGRFTALPEKGTLYRSRISDETRVTLEQPAFSDNDLVFLYVPASDGGLGYYCATGAPPAVGAPYATFSYVISDGQVESRPVTDTINILPHEPLPPLVGAPLELTMLTNSPDGVTFNLPATIPAAGQLTRLTVGPPSTGHLEVVQPDGSRRVLTGGDFSIVSSVMTSRGRLLFYTPAERGGQSGEIDSLGQVAPQADGRLALEFRRLPQHGQLEEWMPDGSRRAVTLDDLPLVVPVLSAGGAPIYYVPDPANPSSADLHFTYGHSWYDGSYGWLIQTLPKHGRLQFSIGGGMWFDMVTLPFNLPGPGPSGDAPIPLRYLPDPDFTTDGASPDSFEYVTRIPGVGGSTTCGTGTVRLHVTAP